MRNIEPPLARASAMKRVLTECRLGSKSWMNCSRGSLTFRSYRPLLAWNHSRVLFVRSSSRNSKSSGVKCACVNVRLNVHEMV